MAPSVAPIILIPGFAILCAEFYYPQTNHNHKRTNGDFHG
jgi:hypothetical protein